MTATASSTETATLPAATAVPTELSACRDAHAATVAQSSDLSPAGRAIAPALDQFNQYRTDLVLDPTTATVTAVQTLVFTNRTGKPLPDIVFHLYPNLAAGGEDKAADILFEGRLEVTCAAVDGVVVKPSYEDRKFILRLSFPAALQPGRTASVTLHFTSQAPRDSENAYGAFSDTGDLWTLASFYPTLAIRLGDGWDTRRPNGWGDFVTSDMALYHMEATFPAGWQVLSTGAGPSTCTTRQCHATLAAGPQRDFALALAAGWQQLRRTAGGATVVSSFPADERAAGERALQLSADAIARFGQAFGPYPYRELDVLPILASGFSGVEYPGLIMISDAYYTDPKFIRSYLQDVVVHEVAHQWWYNVVGNDVLREPWLDEGLTSYTGEYLYPEWSGQGRRPVTTDRLNQLRQRGLDKTPIDLPVDQYRSQDAYTAVIYGRAPLFFDALRKQVGDATFFKLLRAYYARNAFRRATTVGFERLAEQVAGKQLDTFFAQWLRQRTP